MFVKHLEIILREGWINTSDDKPLISLLLLMAFKKSVLPSVHGPIKSIYTFGEINFYS